MTTEREERNKFVYEVARELEMATSELRELIQSWGDVDWDVSHHMKSLTPAQQRRAVRRSTWDHPVLHVSFKT